MTGEITFIGAVTISWYMIETPMQPRQAAERAEQHDARRQVAGHERQQRRHQHRADRVAVEQDRDRVVRA